MTKFRKYKRSDDNFDADSFTWSIQHEEDGEWFDLLEDPSSAVCDVMIDALNKANLSVLSGYQERLPMTNLEKCRIAFPGLNWTDIDANPSDLSFTAELNLLNFKIVRRSNRDWVGWISLISAYSKELKIIFTTHSQVSVDGCLAELRHHIDNLKNELLAIDQH